jgi:hypothetical protein
LNKQTNGKYCHDISHKRTVLAKKEATNYLLCDRSAVFSKHAQHNQHVFISRTVPRTEETRFNAYALVLPLVDAMFI